MPLCCSRYDRGRWLVYILGWDFAQREREREGESIVSARCLLQSWTHLSLFISTTVFKIPPPPPPTSNHLGSPQGASIEATWCQISKVAPWQAARLSACVTVTHLQPGSQTLLHDIYDKEILRYESSTLILYKELSSSIFQSCQWVSP